MINTSLNNKRIEEVCREFERLVLDRKDVKARDFYENLTSLEKDYIKCSEYSKWLRALSMSRI